MNFPEFTFIDKRLGEVQNRFHPNGASNGQFAAPEAKQLYNEIQAAAQSRGAKARNVGKLLTQICDNELIRDQWTHPHFTIDQRVHDGYLTPAARSAAEALYEALSVNAANMIGKAVSVHQVDVMVVAEVG